MWERQGRLQRRGLLNTGIQWYSCAIRAPVGEHFQGAGHSVSDLRYTPVEKIFSNNIFVRRIRERRLINQLDLITNGLNKKL